MTEEGDRPQLWKRTRVRGVYNTGQGGRLDVTWFDMYTPSMLFAGAMATTSRTAKSHRTNVACEWEEKGEGQ